MVDYPNNWKDDEMYDFDWTILKNEKVRFEKIEYNGSSLKQLLHLDLLNAGALNSLDIKNYNNNPKLST